jgi:hypothetical protein
MSPGRSLGERISTTRSGGNAAKPAGVGWGTRLYETDEFGDALTPELRAQEERHREMALANARRG